LVITLLSVLAVMTVAPLEAAHAATQSQLTVASQDSAGSPISGYYTVLSLGGNVASSGFTPANFAVLDGQSYAVQVDNFGACQFDHWADTGSTTSSRAISVSGDTQVTAVYDCGAAASTGSTGSPGTSTSSGSSVTVNSVDQSGNVISGYYTVLDDLSTSAVATGFTAATFATTAGSAYTLQLDGFGICSFSSWSGGTASNPMTFTATGGAISFTAAFNCSGGTSTTTTGGGAGNAGATSGESGAGPGTITIYDHRVPQSDWAACFALVCNAGTGPGASMWVVLYDSSGTAVATGFSNENGYTFTGLNPSATYYLYPADCDQCHTSTHDVLFNHWGDGTSTRPLAVAATGTFVDAWYICTNTCGGV
jgi:hypothetical protein